MESIYQLIISYLVGTEEQWIYVSSNSIEAVL